MVRWPWRARVETKPLPDAEIEHKAVLDSYYRTLSRLGGGLGAPTGPWPVERAVAEGYERVIWVFKCVDTISWNSAKLTFGLHEREKEVDDHPLYRVMNKRANPLETGRAFRKRLSAQVLLSPRGAFVEATKSRGGSVLRYDLLPPGRTYPVPGREPGVLLDHFEVADPRTGRRRRLEPDQVRWIRDPHPIDPYLAITPLEAMGMSVELDHFARLYNVAFLRNDGRPGGVLGVESDMTDAEMNRVESKFGRGPVEAGKLTVVGGKLTYVDTAARPRDMAYGTLAKSAKEEILSGFGVDESVMGLTANRTYDNAEQAEYNFWALTMDAHNSLILSGLDEDSEDELDGYFDTSGIPALELPARKRREEARREVESGLRSIWSYAQLAGIDDIEETPQTRALWLASGKVALASREEDAEALEPAQPAETEEPAAEPVEEDAEGDEAADPLEILSALADAPNLKPAGAKLHLVAGLEPRLALPAGRKAAQPEQEAPTDFQARTRAENALAAVLAAWAARRVAVTEARVQSPKVRKGTRHWTGSATDLRVGDAPLDAEAVVDPDRWTEEVAAAATPVLQQAAGQAAAQVVDALPEPPDEAAVNAAVALAVAAAVALLVSSARRQAELTVRVVATADASGQDMAGILAAVQAQSGGLTRWADTVSIQVTTGLVEGVRAAVAGLARVAGLVKVWRCTGIGGECDSRVRPSHRRANGQRQPPGQPFEVGGALLRYPGDPMAPARETAGCRCGTSLVWRRAAGTPPIAAGGAG